MSIYRRFQLPSTRNSAVVSGSLAIGGACLAIPRVMRRGTTPPPETRQLLPSHIQSVGRGTTSATQSRIGA